MKLLSVFLLILVVNVTSCTHKPVSYQVAGDYMVIGPRGGMMPPKVVYYLTPDHLIADTAVSIPVPTSINLFNFNDTMTSARHAAFKDALTTIPSELLSVNNKEIGISHVAVDGGFIIVMTRINGNPYKWIFHDDLGNTSSEIRQFVSKVNGVYH